MLRIALPEQTTVPRTPFLAVDETSSKVFILTRSGITIAQITVVPLSIASVIPATGATVAIRGSGFQPGATISFGTPSTAATFVDSIALSTTVPALPAGPTRVTVTNPSGQQYVFDAGFTVN